MSLTVAALAYVAASAILIVTPGLDTALILRTAAVEGHRRAAYAGAGICCGLLIWGMAVALGLDALLAASHVAYVTLRAIGAVYLVWLGLTLLLRRQGKTPVLDATAPAELGATAWFARGLLSNLTNPKVGVFFITILPQFVPANVALGPFIALLVTLHVIETVTWFGVLITATRSIAHLVSRPSVTRTLDRATGAVLVGAGLRLAAEEGR